MAEKIQFLFIDDLDGGVAAEGTVRFGLDGAEYEIDLNARHAQELRDAWPATRVLPPAGRRRCASSRRAARAGHGPAG